MNNLAVHFSSKISDWATPQDFFDKIEVEFGPFDLDVCANKKNTKVASYYNEIDDGLSKSWAYDSKAGICWMNPPYGRGIIKWVKKAYEESQKGATIVCLLPARTDTKWFHNYCTKGEIRFIKGRLKFGGTKNSAPFPSMIVVFK